MSQVETTPSLWVAIDSYVPLETEGKVLLEVLSFTESGDTEEQWKKFAKQVDDFGGYFLSEWLVEANDNASRDSDIVTFSFSKPLMVITGFQIKGGVRENIISEISELKLQITYDWFHSEDNKRQGADILEVYGKVVDMK